MRYKLLSFITVLLMATPVLGQETSPIIIETLNPTPSVVRTAESFKVTYRAKFYDQVLIVEEQMQPENIVAEPFEVVKLEIISLPDYGDGNSGIIHVRDFVYTFRIIKPEKGEKKIPPFKFIWVVKNAGTTKDNAKAENELKEILTEEVGVRYATSPVKPPNLNIRDEINFSLFGWSGGTLRKSGYGAITVSSLLSLWIVFALVMSRKNRKSKSDEKNSDEVPEEDVSIGVVPAVPHKKARKQFLKELKKLLKSGGNDNPSPELQKKVFYLLREFILAELSGSPVRARHSDTPADLFRRVEGLSDKQKQRIGLLRYKTFFHLTYISDKYYQDIESGQLTNFQYPGAEIQGLINIVNISNFRKRFVNAIWDYLRISNA